MLMKKQFVTPRVIQQVPIQLEKDLLQGSVRLDSTLSSMGQGVGNYTFSEDPEEESASYFVEW